MKLVLVLYLTLLQVSITIAYNLLEDFSGNTFFNTWDFYGNYDNLTLGQQAFHPFPRSRVVRN